jgi:Protein of unknown function (DUF2934)
LRTTNANSEKSAVDLEEPIRRRAFELYERRGHEASHETEDWLQAEAEVAREKTRSLASGQKKPPVTRAGKRKAKQVNKPRSSTPNRTESE